MNTPHHALEPQRPSRRAFIGTAGAILLWTTSARAQGPGVPVIARLEGGTGSDDAADGFAMGFEEVERAAALLERDVAQFVVEPDADAGATLGRTGDRRMVALITGASGARAREAAETVAAGGGLVFCGSELLVPSAASFMPPDDSLADTIARWAAHRGLSSWHVLAGTSAADERLAGEVRRAAGRHAARIVAEDELPAAASGTLTLPAPAAGADVVIVAAASRGASRIAAARGTAVPIAFCVPGVLRPDGVSSAHAELWHGSLFRYGATQLNDRFSRAFGRPMTSPAWAHWLSVKAAWEATIRGAAGTPGPDPAALAKLAIDGQKGAALRFRPGGRLAQPIYLVERRTNAEGVVEETVVDLPDGAGARRGARDGAGLLARR